MAQGPCLLSDHGLELQTLLNHHPAWGITNTGLPPVRHLPQQSPDSPNSEGLGPCQRELSTRSDSDCEANAYRNPKPELEIFLAIPPPPGTPPRQPPPPPSNTPPHKLREDWETV